MKTRVINLHFAFFFKDIIERPDLEFSDLNSQMLNVFDSMPRMIPIPRELPLDVPIMTLSSENAIYACNISRSRVDFVLNRVSDEKQNSDLFKDFNLKVSGLSKYFCKKSEIARFGMVARYFVQDNNPTATLRKKYFSSLVEGAAEIGLRYVKKSQSFGFEINDIIEISAVEAITNGVKEKGIFIQRDINNTQSSNKIMDFEALSNISKKYSESISESAVMGLIK